MAQYQTGDGRWLVGDVTGESSYHGFLGWRDCVIQLTGEGATEQSVHYLEALRDYALAHNPLGEPIMPPSINVWISNNGTTTAVQADDLSIDGDKFTIGGIVWDGSTWDYSDAGKASGGGSAEPFVVTMTYDSSGHNGQYHADKTIEEILQASNAGKTIIMEKASNKGIFEHYTLIREADAYYLMKIKRSAPSNIEGAIGVSEGYRYNGYDVTYGYGVWLDVRLIAWSASEGLPSGGEIHEGATFYFILRRNQDKYALEYVSTAKSLYTEISLGEEAEPQFIAMIAQLKTASKAGGSASAAVPFPMGSAFIENIRSLANSGQFPAIKVENIFAPLSTSAPTVYPQGGGVGRYATFKFGIYETSGSAIDCWDFTFTVTETNAILTANYTSTPIVST